MCFKAGIIIIKLYLKLSLTPNLNQENINAYSFLDRNSSNSRKLVIRVRNTSSQLATQ